MYNAGSAFRRKCAAAMGPKETIGQKGSLAIIFRPGNETIVV